MNALVIILCVFASFIILALVPRVRLIAEYRPGYFKFSIWSVLLSVGYNISNKVLSGRLLFIPWKVIIDGQETATIKNRMESDKISLKEKTDADVSSKSVADSDHYSSVKPSKKPAQKRFKSVLSDRSITFDIAKRTIIIIRRLFGSVKMDKWESNLTVATSDPMTTGILFGCVSPLHALHKPPNRILIFNIDFDEHRPSGELYCRLSFRPIFILHILLIETMRMPWIKIYRRWQMKGA